MDLENQPYDHHFSSTHLLNRPVLQTPQFHLPLNSLSPKSLSNNYNSSLDYVEEKYLNRFESQEQTLIDERRMRRMVSNRESARRSRMRKRKQIEELQFQVDQLMKLNHQLSEKVISLLENNHQTMQENAELKEKVSSFQMFMADMLLPMRNVEEMNARDMSHILAEASEQLL